MTFRIVFQEITTAEFLSVAWPDGFVPREGEYLRLQDGRVFTVLNVRYDERTATATVFVKAEGEPSERIAFAYTTGTDTSTTPE